MVSFRCHVLCLLSYKWTFMLPQQRAHNECSCCISYFGHAPCCTANSGSYAPEWKEGELFTITLAVFSGRVTLPSLMYWRHLICVCMCVSVSVHACMCICMCLRVRVCVHVHLCAYMWPFPCIHMSLLGVCITLPPHNLVLSRMGRLPAVPCG